MTAQFIGLVSVKFFVINTKLPMLASNFFTTIKKLPPVELNLMITGPRVQYLSYWLVLVSLRLLDHFLVMLY